MIECQIDLWNCGPVDARCITTNGFVKEDGRAVMGRGCALEARNMIPGIDERLGALLRTRGNVPHLLGEYDGAPLLSFPVKHKWNEKADIDLIGWSAYILNDMADHAGWKRVVLPRPGCGNGSLRWEDVKPEIDWLDDRFCVVWK